MAAMPGVEHLGEVNDPDLALAVVCEKRPALVVLDGDLATGTVCELVEQIKVLDGGTRCLVLVEDAAQQREALAAGADRAPLKGYRAEQLFTSLESLLRGTDGNRCRYSSERSEAIATDNENERDARQVEEAGWLGLAGAIAFSLSWWLQTGFVFPEPLMLPVLAPVAPKFVASFLTLASGAPAEMTIGALPAVYGVVGICYLLVGVLFGIATYRARVLPRWAGAFLAFAALFSLAEGVIPHPLDRFAAVPFGLAVAWLGFALLTERRGQAEDPCADRVGTLVPQPEAV